jgi:DNA repair exonuclease SbcCD ATPase subunit
MRAEEESELEQLRLELARREGHIDALEAELKVRSRWDEDLRLVAENLDAQMLGRDEEIAELRRIEQSLREEVEWRRQTEESLQESLRQSEEAHRRVIEGLQQQVEDLQERLATIEATRLWRWGQRYWTWKAAVRNAVRTKAP